MKRVDLYLQSFKDYKYIVFMPEFFIKLIMIKQFSILVVLILLSAFNAFANDDAHKEKVVTSKWSLVFGSAEVSNHFMSDQEYSGPTLGL